MRQLGVSNERELKKEKKKEKKLKIGQSKYLYFRIFSKKKINK